jgi:membrane dipeptidase
VVLVPSTRNGRSQSNWALIVTVLSLTALIAPAVYLRFFFQQVEPSIDPTDYAARTKRALSQTPP